jgi:hypothetical protein
MEGFELMEVNLIGSFSVPLAISFEPVSIVILASESKRILAPSSTVNILLLVIVISSMIYILPEKVISLEIEPPVIPTNGR